MTETTSDPGRRRALEVLVTGTLAALGGALTAILGAFALNPGLRGRRARWVRAASLAELEPNVPVPAVLSVPQSQGWYRTRGREIVFLTWDGRERVTAMSATCTHLGCLVSWDASAEQFRCPCHGGAYDTSGSVVAGPPPRALFPIETRVDRTEDELVVMVRV
jgi:Rieske Fe-S protein